MGRSYGGAHAGAVLALAFDDQGTTLYSSGADKRVLSWALGKTLRAKELAKTKAIALAFWNGELWSLDGASARVVGGKKRVAAKGAARLVATKSRLVAVGDTDAYAIA